MCLPRASTKEQTMTIQRINVGTSPNDKNGDPLRVAFQKVNDNFSVDCHGTLLIVDNYTRKDKLKKINKISNEKGTSDNSI